MRQTAEHLQSCRACSLALEELRALKLTLAQTPVPDARPGFWRGVYAAVEREAASLRQPSRDGWRARASAWAAGHLVALRRAAAAVTVVALAGSLAAGALWWRAPADDLNDLIARHAEHSWEHPLGDRPRMAFVSCEVQAANRD